MKKVETWINEKENEKLNHKAKEMDMTVYAVLKKLLTKFLKGEICLVVVPFWMLIYALNISTLLLL